MHNRSVWSRTIKFGKADLQVPVFFISEKIKIIFLKVGFIIGALVRLVRTNDLTSQE